METIYLSLRVQVAVGTFFMKSTVVSFAQECQLFLLSRLNFFFKVKRVSFDTKSNRLHDDFYHRETQSNLDPEKIQGDKINQNVVQEPLDQIKPNKESTNKESKSSETLPSQKLCTVSKMNSSIFNSPFNKGMFILEKSSINPNSSTFRLLFATLISDLSLLYFIANLLFLK